MVCLNRLNSQAPTFRYYQHNRNKCAYPCNPTDKVCGRTSRRVIAALCITVKEMMANINFGWFSKTLRAIHKSNIMKFKFARSGQLQQTIKRTVAGLTAILGLSAAVPSEAAQPFHPFAESMNIDPDYQWFAPVDMQELNELSARKRANRGWFVAYDRLHFGLNRPETTAQTSKIDMTWGNRWDLGFMSEKDRGWLFSFTHVSGPNVYDDTRIVRGPLPTTAGGANSPAPQNVFLTSFPAFIARFPFDPAFGDGTFLNRQSVNVASLSSFEANKTWRFEPYRYGGILEPLVGFRYMQFNDYAVAQLYTGIQNDADVAVDIDQFSRTVTRTDNQMVMGQLGYRYFSTLNRMTFSQESRFFAGQNFQTQGFESRTYQYTPGDADGLPILGQSSAFGGRDNSESVVGLDARAEAAMQLTKAFNVRAGMQVLYIGRGIWRGANPGQGNQNLFDQAIVSPAFTFGMAFNR